MKGFVAYCGETSCKNPPFIARSRETLGKKKSEKLPSTFYKEGLSIEIVARGTGLSIEEVQQLQLQLTESTQG